jgi:thymidylate synthase (FAD)
MRVTPIAHTVFDLDAAVAASDYVAHDAGPVTDADELGEFAGRACYESWHRPNPATATNDGYMANILSQNHESVLEHSSVSFYVEGVSRSLLAELTRHRHLSFSVLSQRYVRLDSDRVVLPPLIDEYGDTPLILSPFPPEWGGQDWTIQDEIDDAIQHAFDAYNAVADKLISKGVPRKKALEAARCVLPQAAESPLVVTGNLRAWRDVLGKRHHVAADAEIQMFAAEVLRHLRAIAPASVQDIPDEPYGSFPPDPPAAPEAAAVSIQVPLTGDTEYTRVDIPFNPAA